MNLPIRRCRASDSTGRVNPPADEPGAVFRYYFGVTAWRRRLRRIVVGVGVAAGGVAAGTVVGTRAAYVAGLVAVFGGLWYAQAALKPLFVPAPWTPAAWRYGPLRHALDVADADRWLDVGTGTGRSLVGLAESRDENAPEAAGDRWPADVTAVDDFDRFGVGPLGRDAATRAERNAETAGLSVDAVRGDPSRLPVESGSQDVVTACGVLSELDEPAAEAAVSEARRVLRDDGQFGVLAAPGRRGGEADAADPLAYWSDALESAGFTVDVSGAVSRGDARYCYLACSVES